MIRPNPSSRIDDVARAHYELEYRVAFNEKKGQAFQDFFSEIMEKRYPADFVRVRAWGPAGDRKNDGVLRSERMLFQCYAPNELTAAACIAKIDEDFNGALVHWKEHFDTWVFVHNERSGLGPDVTAKLLELEAAHGLRVTSWGFEELRQRVFGLKEAELASLFGPAPSRSAMMKLGLADLAPVLDTIVRLPAVDDADLRPVPAEKISYNCLSEDVAILLRAGMSRAPLVHRYFARRPLEQDRIAASFRREYDRLRSLAVGPDEIFLALQTFAGGREISLAARTNAILACLAFFFEECEIFDRPDSTEVP